ncbi:MAG: pirin family protein, partial [Syntrophales bacterium LBB04]|nr:pirin family protein [Syntrophales bacterium LBB04]
MQTRSIKKIFTSKPVLEGAGVHLNRAFGYYEMPQFDPFLLMDDFRNTDPGKYLKGFPWHPHRGIETITYMLEGFAEHGDSMGNKGTIGPGDVQWMTAGSGIIHQEMPKPGPDGRMFGFQLWANLPASNKMMRPRYQDVKSAEIPEIILDNGVKIRVICGETEGAKGPVQDIVIDPEYLDITVPAGIEYFHPTKKGYTVFIYVIGGKGEIGESGEASRQGSGENVVENHTLVLFEDGDQVRVKAGDDYVRFLLVSGKPLNEPIAWGGPIVMNTKEELDL